ncbi:MULTISPECIES: sensor histidine kinase [Streptomyces]|uniref:sensor histidine kinase n=1 Tax=Streptomyces TaxID=1883 RepID=UPI00163C6267|nr:MULTISPECIES: ATP-binding protein [Streptomyces]MBC2878994.1 histidine kinase [Streptomyces sp. TYQ1024]UBI40656.1 histidine kinase [Streptomyces mobaraensis]UKW33239.1 ATP-binding protein [Streptomyces sp. TYQ1024]
MTTHHREERLGGTTALASRRVAWIRLAMTVPLFMAGRRPPDVSYRHWFDGLLVAYLLWAVGRMLWIRRRPVADVRGAAGALVVDLALITALAAVSGGPDSPVRYAYFLWSTATVLWQMPKVTAVFGAVCVVCYAAMSLPHALTHPAADSWDIVVDEAYLLWTVGASVLIAVLLARRSRRVAELLDTRELLLDDALAAETRERSRVADALHDGAVQTLLAALHDLEEAEGAVTDPAARAALDRAQGEVRRTVREMREIIFNLHPQILAAAGLGAALEAAGERFARRGGFRIHYDVRLPGRVGHEALLYSTARELLRNIVKHARADDVWLTLSTEGDETVLTVRDNGVGFDPGIVQDRLRAGHIGLASHYVRVESAGGRFTADSAPGAGTTIEVRLPTAAPGPPPPAVPATAP